MPERLPAASAGLGLRRALLDELIEAPAGAFDFLECAPDNWIGVGGRWGVGVGGGCAGLHRRVDQRALSATAC